FMKYLKRKYSRYTGNVKHEDPLSGMANLFDVALVFIVALFLAFMAAFQMLDFFDAESEMTIMKKSGGRWQIITKKGKEIKVMKVTDQKIGGDEGMRLGIAYQLKSGQIIYVPEDQEGDNK
ncbi:MAG: DUF2149 domain-containing protein, partial [Candidatus Anammoxibacter sp.]